MRGAAELKSREEVQTESGQELKFSFKEYMMKRAQLVNEALDKAVPLQYPEAVTEAMRYALPCAVSGMLFGKHIGQPRGFRNRWNSILNTQAYGRRRNGAMHQGRHHVCCFRCSKAAGFL